MVPISKMRRFSCLLRLSLPPEMGEMAQTFISEIDWLTALKYRATGLSTSLFLTERRCLANLSDRRRPVSSDVKFTTFTARNAVNDVGGGAYKIVPNLGPEIDVAELRFLNTCNNEHVQQRAREQEYVPAGDGRRALCTNYLECFDYV